MVAVAISVHIAHRMRTPPAAAGARQAETKAEAQAGSGKSGSSLNRLSPGVPAGGRLKRAVPIANTASAAHDSRTAASTTAFTVARGFSATRAASRAG